MKTKTSIINKLILIPASLLILFSTTSAFAVEPTSLPPGSPNPKGMERCCDDERNTLNKKNNKMKSSSKSSIKTKTKTKTKTKSKTNPKGMERCCDDEKNPAVKLKR